MRSPARGAVTLIPVLVALACSRDDRAQHPAPPIAKPRALTVSENLAEDIQDDLAARGWRAADGKLADLLSELDGVTRSMTGDVVVPWSDPARGYRATLDSLMARVAQRDRLGSLIAANLLSRQLASISAGYPSRIPVAVTMLDVSGRDALYCSEAGLWSAAAAAIGEFRRHYVVLRAHVTTTDSKLDARVVVHLDASGAAVQRQSLPDVRVAVGALLEDVDLIEQTY